MSYELRYVTRDGARVLQLRCPGCARWGDIDDDQLHGRVSVEHNVDDGGCGWHETHDFTASLALAGIPRRNRLDLNTPAELAIRVAVDEVEKVGAHTLLTEAVILLGHAREKVADYVDLAGA